MSYNNVMGGKLKLKGKALDVKSGGVKKKKKKEKGLQVFHELPPSTSLSIDPEAAGNQLAIIPDGENGGEESKPLWEDHRTPAEKRYAEQKAKIEEKNRQGYARKSHRQKIEQFNQYLANLSEHYDIPKVGPG